MKDRAHETARNCNYDGYQKALASIVCKFFDKESGLGASLNEKLSEELQNAVIKKLKRRKVYARFKDKIWAADSAEMGLSSSSNKNIRYFLCVIDDFTKYAWVKPLKDKKKVKQF